MNHVGRLFFCCNVKGVKKNCFAILEAQIAESAHFYIIGKFGGYCLLAFQ